ncbi:hypothetical protein QTJ16_004369 [Diplocarpon rosae]|uniref:Prefoldin subunit 5 n=1 Tax=Diplocarpon rosae TaxID=946125 RepID=A0AAD9SZY1_9HELO|nr:hypothetical protein QTJ16_004369 [Diplocarpon rosae]
MSSPRGQQVDLSSLSTQQLSQVKKQLDDEIEHLTNSHGQLRQAQAKFRECIRSIAAGVTPALDETKSILWQSMVSNMYKYPGKPILVPLTTSLYVPGTLADPHNVIVDVGTGFYVEKNTKDATKFYEAKVEELGGNLRGLEAIVQGKSKNLSVVEDGMSRLEIQDSLLIRASSAQGEGSPSSCSTSIFIWFLENLKDPLFYIEARKAEKTLIRGANVWASPSKYWRTPRASICFDKSRGPIRNVQIGK